jgi:hypothetical protein
MQPLQRGNPAVAVVFYPLDYTLAPGAPGPFRFPIVQRHAVSPFLRKIV